MTHLWIVGVDGSDNARHALQWTVNQAVGRDVVVRALAAGMPFVDPGDADAVVVTDPPGTAGDRARMVEQLIADVAGAGVHVEARVAPGPAAHLLIEASRDADLLVVGTRGMGRIKGALWGSVSQRCAAHSHAPVAVIGLDAPVGPVGSIVVGYDGSVNAGRAATWALDFAADHATVSIIDALALAPWLSAERVRERFPDEVAEVEREFAEHMAELDPSDRATKAIVIADARLALAAAAQHSDLLVLGARGRGRIGSALLGSTTTWLLQGPARATVVVPSR